MGAFAFAFAFDVHGLSIGLVATPLGPIQGIVRSDSLAFLVRTI